MLREPIESTSCARQKCACEEKKWHEKWIRKHFHSERKYRWLLTAFNSIGNCKWLDRKPAQKRYCIKIQQNYERFYKFYPVFVSDLLAPLFFFLLFVDFMFSLFFVWPIRTQLNRQRDSMQFYSSFICSAIQKWHSIRRPKHRDPYISCSLKWNEIVWNVLINRAKKKSTKKNPRKQCTRQSRWEQDVLCVFCAKKQNDS